MSEDIRVLIADDDETYCTACAQLLNGEEGIAVVATALNGAEAIAALGNKIDVALLDVDMPVLDGISAAKLIKQVSPQTALVMLTAFEHRDSLEQSLAAGVQGFITKDTLIDDLADYIRKAFSGQIVYDSRPAAILTENYVERAQAREHYQDFIAAAESLPGHLHSTFNLLLEARTNKEIAVALHMSPATIRSYVSDILALTGCVNRGELAITAVKAGVDSL